MNVIDLWKNIGEQFFVYTKETARAIPEQSGIYGWFIPLWLLNDDLDQYITLINKFYLYSPKEKGVPEKKESFDFNWDAIDIELTRSMSKKASPSSSIVRRWNRVVSDTKSGKKEVVAQSLMKASLFMPPLYVGKADNLLDRYQQHIVGCDRSNTFNTRFTAYSKEVELNLSVSDLLFVCITTQDQDAEGDKNEVNELIEQVVMRLCRPTFSMK